MSAYAFRLVSIVLAFSLNPPFAFAEEAPQSAPKEPKRAIPAADVIREPAAANATAAIAAPGRAKPAAGAPASSLEHEIASTTSEARGAMTERLQKALVDSLPQL